MKRVISILTMALFALTLGCGEKDMATKTEEAVGGAKKKADEIQQEEQQRVDEVNEAMQE